MKNDKIMNEIVKFWMTKGILILLMMIILI